MYIEFSHVTTHCKGFSLKDISFLVPEGFITGLVGENGAGKTTLFHQIMDENARYSGEIYIQKRTAAAGAQTGIYAGNRVYLPGTEIF